MTPFTRPLTDGQWIDHLRAKRIWAERIAGGIRISCVYCHPIMLADGDYHHEAHCPRREETTHADR